ncbi:CBU_0592 family membrane protein [Marinovum sp.]|uniref:CBU_0592 family membrane protein n=1 Tax=Marinovum sp. TaxID=2024839 RepID=UPI003A8CEAD3
METFQLSLDTRGFFEALGVTGFLFYVGSFAALQLRLLDGNSVAYTLCNIAAAGLVLVSLIHDFNLASALIQTSWVIIGLGGLGLRMRRPKG